MKSTIDIPAITIRPLHFEEIPVIQFIASVTWPVTFGDVMPAELIDHMMKKMYSTESLIRQFREHQVFCLAFAGYEPLGYVSYELDRNNSGQTQLHKLYILPKAQGMQVGKQLLNHVCKTASENGDRQIRLKVYSKNQKAINFYERNGFSIAASVTTELGDDFRVDDLVMVKEL